MQCNILTWAHINMTLGEGTAATPRSAQPTRADAVHLHHCPSSRMPSLLPKCLWNGRCNACVCACACACVCAPNMTPCRGAAALSMVIRPAQADAEQSHCRPSWCAPHPAQLVQCVSQINMHAERLSYLQSIRGPYECLGVASESFSSRLSRSSMLQGGKQAVVAIVGRPQPSGHCQRPC